MTIKTKTIEESESESEKEKARKKMTNLQAPQSIICSAKLPFFDCMCRLFNFQFSKLALN